MPNKRRNMNTKTKSVINKNKFELLMESDEDDTSILSDTDIVNETKPNAIKETKINAIKETNTNTVKETKTVAVNETKTNNNKGIYVPPIVNNNDTNKWEYNSNNKRRNNHNRNNRKYNKNIQFIEETGEELEFYNNNSNIKGNNMKLNSTWTVWIHENTLENGEINKVWDIGSYVSIYNIDNIGSLWRFLSVFDNLDKNTRQYYLMRDGITPIWEDNNNKNGGICSIMFENMNRHRRNMNADIGVDIFIAICILVVNESFVKNNLDINGLCYSVKNRCVLIKLWIKDYVKNTEFLDSLPITLLKKIENILLMMENENNIFRNNGRSRVSVQIKKIQPNY